MKTPSQTTALTKGILIGAGSAGVVSLIPLVNLLNLFFMFWMAIGGAIGVWMFQRRNRRATPGEAALCGGLSGFFGGLIFALVTYVTLFFITPEGFERVLSLLQKLLPSLHEEMDTLNSGQDFRDMLRLVLLMSIGVSGLVGILGGLTARWAWSPPEAKQKDTPDKKSHD